ncbi:MAG: chorismate-binding protein [Gordonia sp. (in: high G+C Gram-positive bacteria)]
MELATDRTRAMPSTSPQVSNHAPATTFLLSRTDYHAAGSGCTESFRDPAEARDALRSGRRAAVAGALPFDTSEPSALFAPASFVTRSGRWEPGVEVVVPAARIENSAPTPDEHVRRLDEAIALLRAQDSADADAAMGKIVLARKLHLTLDEPLSPWTLAARLRAADRGGNVYVTDLSTSAEARRGCHLVGSSPEVLIRKNGRHVTCHPLAGSAPRSADPGVDEQRGRDLSASTKDLAEHRYVVDAIEAALAPLCRTLDVPREPSLVTTSAMWHLGTPIHGEIADPSITSLDLALAMHPTPAICGTPTSAARDHIVRVEGSRGFYAGAVGWSRVEGHGTGGFSERGEWMVAIRCTELAGDGRSATAYAGGGIVAESDSAAELAETAAKFRTVLAAFGVTESR